MITRWNLQNTIKNASTLIFTQCHTKWKAVWLHRMLHTLRQIFHSMQTDCSKVFLPRCPAGIIFWKDGGSLGINPPNICNSQDTSTTHHANSMYSVFIKNLTAWSYAHPAAAVRALPQQQPLQKCLWHFVAGGATQCQWKGQCQKERTTVWWCVFMPVGEQAFQGKENSG